MRSRSPSTTFEVTDEPLDEDYDATVAPAWPTPNGDRTDPASERSRAAETDASPTAMGASPESRDALARRVVGSARGRLIGALALVAVVAALTALAGHPRRRLEPTIGGAWPRPTLASPHGDAAAQQRPTRLPRPGRRAPRHHRPVQRVAGLTPPRIDPASGPAPAPSSVQPSAGSVATSAFTPGG